MSHPPQSQPNRKRVAAGRRNRAKRGPITAEGLEQLRQAALLHQPWLLSTGPRSERGKQQARANGKRRQKGEESVREAEREVAGIFNSMDSFDMDHLTNFQLNPDATPEEQYTELVQLAQAVMGAFPGLAQGRIKPPGP